MPNTPQQLITGARCFDEKIPAGFRLSALIFLFQQIQGGNLTPQQILDGARCIDSCIPQGFRNSALIYLLNLIAGGGGGSCGALSGDAPPTGSVTPQFVGQLYNQNNGEAFFYSTGLTSSDWTEIVGGGGSNDYSFTTSNGSTYEDLISWLGVNALSENPELIGITSLTFEKVVLMKDAVDIRHTADLLSVSFPLLTSATGDGLGFQDNLLLSSIAVTVFQSAETFFMYKCPAMVSLSFPALTTLGADGFYILDCTAFTTLSLPLLTSFGGDLILTGNALSAATVNALLAKLVSIAAYGVGRFVDFSGGTSAGTSLLTVQGAADVATLVGRGATVTLNP